jgi:hypothetical protein
VIRDPHPDYDGGWSATNDANYKLREQKPHWDLYIDYIPGKKTYQWTLYPQKPGTWSARGIVDGEGATPQIADQICIVVTGHGANIR